MKSNKSIPRNTFQYEYLASEYFIAASPLLDQCSHKAHDLYELCMICARAFLRESTLKAIVN
nr:hypothetical protein [Lactobacillus helveticus]